VIVDAVRHGSKYLFAIALSSSRDERSDGGIQASKIRSGSAREGGCRAEAALRRLVGDLLDLVIRAPSTLRRAT